MRQKGNAVPLQACSGPEGSRNLMFPDFTKTAKDGGKVISVTHRSPLPPGNTPGYPRAIVGPEGLSLKNSNNTIENRTRDLTVCSVVP